MSIQTKTIRCTFGDKTVRKTGEGETMKVPKVIECYLKRCNNTDFTYNHDGDCYWGIVFHVKECHSYAPKKKEKEKEAQPEEEG